MRVAAKVMGIMVSGLVVFGITVNASAAVCDLTTAGATCTVNGAIAEQIDPQATGSGVIDPFVRISGNTDVVQGYNTDGRPLQFDENSSPTFTHDLALSAVPIVNIGGTDYRQFLLDINQTAANSLLSLHEIQVFVTNNSGSLGAVSDGSGGVTIPGATKIYDLDSGPDGDSVIELDYILNHGSGSGDMFLYIPDSLFTGGTNVILFSAFGQPNPNNDGFEEWAVLTPGAVVPEPSSLLLLGFGLTGASLIGARVARRRRSQ